MFSVALLTESATEAFSSLSGFDWPGS